MKLADAIVATPAVAALAPLTPFVAPEALARSVGRTDLLRLGANESAFGPSPRARAAMEAELARISYYGDPESRDLREALAAKHACSYEEISVGLGIDDLLGSIVRAFAGGGEAIVATTGTYPTFFYHVAGYGARAVTAPYRADGSLPLDELAALVRAERPRLVYVVNPDNPSGALTPAAQILALLAELPPQTLLVLDEAYADFVAPENLPALERDPRVIRLRTFSKAYGLAGARIAYALAAPEVGKIFDKIRQHFGVNRLAQAGALAALGDQAFIAGVVREVAAGRSEYVALAASLGLTTLASHTNFVCFDLGTRVRAEALVRALLERGVFIRKPGAAPIDRCVRVTVGTREDRARLADVLPGALAAVDAMQLG